MFDSVLEGFWGKKKEDELNYQTKEFTTWISETKNNAVSLKLDIIGNETLVASSDVTDHYVETNVAFQDHITRKPLIYTVEGEIGELVYYNKDQNNSLIAGLPTKLVPITTFLPSVSKKMYSVMDKATKILDLVDSVDNFVEKWVKLFKSDNQNLQSNAFCYLLSLWYIRKPITIQTAWRKLSNYVITNIEFTQPRETKDKTRIKISFKEFRQVKSIATPFDPKKFRERAATQKAELINLGQTNGNVVTTIQCKANQWCPIPGKDGLYWY